MNKAQRIVLYGLLALLLTAVLALALVVRIGLAPARGEWAVQRSLGPFTLDLGVPTLLRVATAPWLAPRLDGLRLRTRQGPVRLRWDAPQQQLVLRCAPCGVQVAALGPQPLLLDHLEFSVQRDADRLHGTLEAAAPRDPEAPQGAAALRGRWSGRLSQTALELDIDMDEAPIARWYAVAAPQLAELRRARIGGTLGLRMQIALPAQRFALQPRVAQFSVAGLGTEAMPDVRGACGAPSHLDARSWLARAVLAAEDQRFFQHPGYDLIELNAALARNQQKGGIDRGGSTLTQQLAKMLVTGSERSLARKLRELLYAVEMEQTLGKARILQLYLDNAPWGRVCGAEAAARLYFKRSAAQLEPAQAVWLASMLHAPGLAAERWARDGELDARRVQWVAEGIRGISRQQREALLQAVQQVRYPWAADARGESR